MEDLEEKDSSSTPPPGQRLGVSAEPDLTDNEEELPISKAVAESSPRTPSTALLPLLFPLLFLVLFFGAPPLLLPMLSRLAPRVAVATVVGSHWQAAAPTSEELASLAAAPHALRREKRRLGVDPWGHGFLEFHLRSRARAPAPPSTPSSSSQLLPSSATWFLRYSSGPDGVDERGLGDDVVPTPWEFALGQRLAAFHLWWHCLLLVLYVPITFWSYLTRPRREHLSQELGRISLWWILSVFFVFGVFKLLLGNPGLAPYRGVELPFPLALPLEVAALGSGFVCTLLLTAWLFFRLPKAAPENGGEAPQRARPQGEEPRPE